VKLVWSAFALSDRDEIYDFIESESPRFAAVTDKRIADSVRLLLDFPEGGRVGRVGRVKGTHECVIPRSPYFAAYTVTGEVIRILRVLHGAQRWPEAF
jgi:toxin ParE1/3/4